MAPLESSDSENSTPSWQIVGNVSEDLKKSLSKNLGLLTFVPPWQNLFGGSIQRRIKITEISIYNDIDKPKTANARVVVELDVSEDMLNAGGVIHGGCSAFLVDLCSTFAIHALYLANNSISQPEDLYTVSQSLNTIYHASASLGEKLEIINTTLTLGARALSARTEIWSKTHNRLVVSGTHVKMIPSVKSRM